MMQKGEAELVTSFGKTAAPSRFVHYLGPACCREKNLFWLPKACGDLIQSYQDLYVKHIGLLRGSVYYPRFDHDEAMDKVAVNHESRLFQVLARGRIDAFVGYQGGSGRWWRRGSCRISSLI